MAWNLEKLIVGSFLFFVEEGRTVDTTEVDKDFYPDNDPASNWTDGSLGCVEQFAPQPDIETYTDYCPSAAGGYDKDDDEVVVRDVFAFTLREHNEPFWRMLLGVNNEIVDGTAQTPLARRRRWLKGWLKVQARADDGQDRIVMNLYGKLAIDQAPTWSKDPTKPAMKFQKLYSSIATVDPDGIQEAALT